MSPDIVQSDTPLTPDLLDAFWRYDTALLAGDVTTLDSLFEPSPHTLRADATGVLVGHAAIRDFRAARPDRPARRISRLWTQVLSPDLVYTTAEVRSASGSQGLQTQLWRRTDGAWRICAAHVTPPSRPVDGTVWRMAGAPLVHGAPDGRLHGETVAVKDLYALRGFARGAGVKDFLAEQEPQQQTAAAVRSLLAAGADITGLAHTDQFAFGLAGQNADWGTPVNAAAPTRLPGGSSSGSACAVRNGWASIGLGTDTAGSIRVPADYQGLWGLRPTHGVVSTEGLLPLAPSFDTVAWLTRDHATLESTGEVLLPADTGPRPTRATWSAQINAAASEPVRHRAEQVAAALDAEPLPALPDVTAWTPAFRTVQAAEAWKIHGPWIESHPRSLAPSVEARFSAGRNTDERELERAWETIHTARTALEQALADSYLVLPTTSSVVPRVNASQQEIDQHRDGTLRLTTLASLAGFPSITLPVASLDDAPLGVSLISAPGTDRALLRIAGEVATRLAQL